MNCTVKQRRAAWILLVGLRNACPYEFLISNNGEHFYEKTQTYIRCTFFAFYWLLVILGGCGKAASSSAPAPSASQSGSKPLKIVTTIFPEYDWVREILGDRADHAEVTMLLDNGVDLHSYQPTADDIIRISDCDLFIYVGGESDGWVEDALKEAANKDMQVINLLDVLGEQVKKGRKS